MGGGARNLGRGGAGGVGSRVGESGGESAAEWISVRVLLAGGGAGGGPRREVEVDPVFCGLIEVSFGNGGAPGGGGGGAFPFLSLATEGPSPSASAACFCSTQALMNSEFCSI
jgi:hypothetical protein